MAKIEFTGFVDPWSASEEQHPKWGMKVVELHSRKKENSEEWETVGRTWRTVRAAYGTEIDFTEFKKGDRVTITGTEVTVASESNGKKFYNLTVNAASITAEQTSPKNSEWVPATSAPVSDDEPF